MAGSLNIRLLFLIPLFLFLGACVLHEPVTEWPDGIPARAFFVEQWQQDAVNRDIQPIEDYLLWINRFYQGFNLVPGWLQVIDRVSSRVAVEESATVRLQLEGLGRRIGSEWAKDNQVRKLNTRMAAVWRDALIEALAQDDLQAYIARMSQDVEGIMAGALQGDDIQFERYYLDEFSF
jgi:hypothetical protein